MLFHAGVTDRFRKSGMLGKPVRIRSVDGVGRQNIFPALSAMRVYKNFRAVTICAAVLSVCCATLGILISILAGTPVGSTIVAVDIFAFLIFSGISRLGGIRT